MPRPATVLFTETGRLGGGSFEGLRLMLTALDRERFRPVAVFTSPTRYLDQVRDLGVPVHLVRDVVLSTGVNRRAQKWAERLQERPFSRSECVGKFLAARLHSPLLRTLERIAAQEGVDLLYSNNQVNRSLFMPMLAERLGLPLVVHLRSPGAESFSPRKRDYVERWVSAWIAISKQVENYWREHGLRGPVSLIPNGLPEFTVEPVDLAAEFGVPKGNRVAAILARLVWEKAHDFLLDAFKVLVSRRQDATLLIVGDGPKKDEIEAQVRREGLSGNVILTGYDPRGREIMAGADLVVQPSMTDSFSRAVMEAMRLGTPTAITSKGSALEAVEPGVHSLVMEYGDVPGLADALEQGLFNDAARQGLAERGRALMAERFDLAAQTRKVEAVMEQALKRGPGPYPPSGR